MSESNETFPFENQSEKKLAEAAAERLSAPEPKQKKTDIALDSQGRFAPVNISEGYRLAEALYKSKCIPKQFTTIEMVLMGQQYLRQLDFPDIVGLSKLCIVNGTYCLFSEAPLALVLQKKVLSAFDEFWITKDFKKICLANSNLDDEAYASVCMTSRGDLLGSVERVFSMKDAGRAGLLSKQGPWKLYQRRMLQLRARSWALKDSAPDVLLGVGIAEYDFNVLPEAMDVETKSDRASEINATFKTND